MTKKDQKIKEKEIHDRLGCVPETSNCIAAGMFVDRWVCRVCGKEWRG